MLENFNMESLRKQVERFSRAMMLVCMFTFSLSICAVAQGDAGVSKDPAVVSAGKALFEDNCAQCHSVHEKVVGPALKDLTKRRKVDWIKSFVTNSQKVIKSGDKYAIKLYNEYGKMEMPTHDFSDDELNGIIAYVADESSKPPVAEVQEGSNSSAGTGVAASSGVSSDQLTLILLVNVIILFLILIVLIVVVKVLVKYLNQKEGLDAAEDELVNQKFSLVSVLKSKAFVGLATLVFVAVVTKTVLDGLFSIGVQQGYAPVQPIAFSHEIHAGQYQIDCNYCHTGVTKSKNANIPSVNICMNCHSSIKTDSKEIQKLYTAVEKNEPIQWVRVHNLPDLAYFNHSQHVKVGGIACQTCHGAIETMAVVKQENNLTMGWCINCHRETKVNAEGNAYYDKLVELHKESSKEPLTVSDIGGLECSKCHY